MKLITDIMTARALLNPPSHTDVDNIDLWLHDLQIWKCVTELVYGVLKSAHLSN